MIVYCEQKLYQWFAENKAAALVCFWKTEQNHN